MKKLTALFAAFALLLTGCAAQIAPERETTVPTQPGVPEITATQIQLSDDKITVDGKDITNDSNQAVYAANDIVFYLAGQDFTYGEGTQEDAHDQAEADAHTVVHITKPGSYRLSGKLSAGQIAVDLGKDAEEDPEAVVTLILDGVDITCSVAPAVIFYNVYECGSSDEETATKDVDTSKAGANVIIAADTENNINGAYVAKIYKSYTLNADGTEVVDSKKLHKYDGAFYSKKSMNISGGAKGNGVLNIQAENEGLDSELHLTLNGGIVNINSGNDGINTNEDNVSVTTINGGALNILCNGATGEGDGIDSNGWLVINGGAVNAQACATSGDAGIDSDKGIYINGGSLVATGNMLDWIAGGNATYAVFSFASRQDGKGAYALKNGEGKTVGEYAPTNGFTYLIIAGEALVPGEYTFWQGDTQLVANAGGNIQGGMPGMPGGMEWPEGQMPTFPEGQMPSFSWGEGQGWPGGQMPEFPQEGRPEMPNGMGGMQPPGGMGGNMMPGGEITATFTIVEGANQFAGVAPQ